jgi:hypothetical protein
MNTTIDMKIDPLKDNNYDSWNVRMFQLLVLKGLDDIVETGPIDHDDADNDDENAPAIPADVLASRALDKKAKALIGAHLSDQFLSLYRSSATAKDLWDSLEDMFRQRSNVRRLALRRELHSLKKSSSESLSAYFARATKLRDDLVAIGVDIPEDSVVDSLLAGLPAQYDVNVAILQSGDAALTIDGCLSKLLSVEHKLAKESSDASAFYSNVKPIFKPYQGLRRQQTGQKPNPHAHLTCNHCKKKGHIKPNCHKWKAEIRRQVQAERSEQHASASFASAHMTHVNGSVDKVYSVHVHDNCQPHRWVLDTGASMHMACSRDVFSEYNEYDYSRISPPVTVDVANGTHATVHGIGHVMLHTMVDGVEEVHVLKNVLHVPDLQHNLFSIREITKSGPVHLLFEDDMCTVSCKDHPLVEAYADNDLYWVYSTRDAPKPCASANTASASEPVTVHEEMQLWHRRLAHLGWAGLGKLIDGNLVSGIIMKRGAAKYDALNDKPVCEPCLEAKHARQPFRASDTVSSAVLDLIHMDLCGPYQEESLGGSRYTATFLDDFSKYYVVRTLAHKSDVTVAVKEVIALLENQTGKHVKVVRTDRGGEYVNKELSAFFRSKGIIHQYSAPYSPQQNGSAERLNRTLNDRVRAMLLIQ